MMVQPKYLRDLDLKIQYDSYDDQPLEEFLIPALEHSKYYDRAVGYFSSALLAVIPEAFSNFTKKGGRMRLVCSPVLSIADAQLFESLSDLEIDDHLTETMQKLAENNDTENPLKLMAWMVKSGSLEIRIAVPKVGTAGIFHQKIGIFLDSKGDQVAFSGSNNETLKAWGDFSNSESFTVHKGWLDDTSSSHVELLVTRFERFWRNRYPGFDFLSLGKARQFLEATAPDDVEIDLIKSRLRDKVTGEGSQKGNATFGSQVKLDKKLRDYQLQAVENWFESEQGIISFATGAGKTVTALEVMERWSKRHENAAILVLVPSVKLQEQWVNEILAYKSLSESSILLVGGGGQTKIWSAGLPGYTSGRVAGDLCITVAVMDSAAKSRFVEKVNWNPQLLIVADEVHNLGAPSFLNLLEAISRSPRLGLSATPERYEEDESHLLKRIFGNEIEPIIGIKEALGLGVLVPYTYHFEKVKLEHDEQEEYRRLTEKIRKARAGSEKSEKNENNALKMAKIARARVIKEARRKVEVASTVVEKNYKQGESWLIFCADKKQLDVLRVRLSHLKPFTYHQAMEGDSGTTLSEFSKHGGILLSINMMTEGVDIPSIEKCVILASSQNRREYVQRRGRVLRVNPKAAKDVHIWDLLVVDDDGLAFTDSELDRAKEFAGIAKNMSIIFELEAMERTADRKDFRYSIGRAGGDL